MIREDSDLSIALEQRNHCVSDILIIGLRSDDNSSLSLVLTIDDSDLVTRLKIFSHMRCLQPKLFSEVRNFISQKDDEPSI